MAIQFRHATLRPPGQALALLDAYLEEHGIGFALISLKGLFLAANDRFLARTDQPCAMIGTLPSSHLEHVWSSHVSKRDRTILSQWLATRDTPSGAWNGTVRDHTGEGKQVVSLFRTSLSLSGEEQLFLFRSSPEPNHQPGLLGHHFLSLKKVLLPLILDLRDYATLLPLFIDREIPPWKTSVLLAEEPRWIPGTSFLRITSRQKQPEDSPQWISLKSERTDRIFPPPTRRALFSMDPSLPEQVFLNLPLFRETSFYGWIVWPFSGEGAHRGTLYRRRTIAASGLSEQLHETRSDLLLLPALEKERTQGLYSHRGILKAVQDLMSRERNGAPFGLIGITLADPAGIDPLATHLQTFLRASDLLGHVSPMEFLLIVTDSDRDRTRKTFRRLLSLLEPVALSDYRLNARIGLCHYPEDGTTPVRILRKVFRNDAVHIGLAYQGSLFPSHPNTSNSRKIP